MTAVSPHLDAEHLGVLDVQLVQRLDVVRREGDGDQQDVPLPSLAQTFDDVVRLGAEPLHGPHLQGPTGPGHTLTLGSDELRRATRLTDARAQPLPAAESG